MARADAAPPRRNKLVIPNHGRVYKYIRVRLNVYRFMHLYSCDPLVPYPFFPAYIITSLTKPYCIDGEAYISILLLCRPAGPQSFLFLPGARVTHETHFICMSRLIRVLYDFMYARLGLYQECRSADVISCQSPPFPCLWQSYAFVAHAI